MVPTVPTNKMWCYFLKGGIYFFNCILLILLLQLSQFSPFAPSTQHPLLTQAISPPLFLSMSHAYKFFSYSISYTLLYIPMAIL